MPEETSDLLREAVQLLRGIKKSLDEAERARTETLQHFRKQTDQLIGSGYEDFDGETAFGSEMDFDTDASIDHVSDFSSASPFDVDALEAEFQECQEDARRFEEETRDFREVVTLELRRQSAILERIATALGADRRDREQG